MVFIAGSHTTNFRILKNLICNRYTSKANISATFQKVFQNLVIKINI